MEKLRFLDTVLYIFEKVHCYIVFIITPGFLIFELAVVRPVLVEIYKLGIAKQFLHISLCIFCFINVAGNMMMSILSDSSLRNRRSVPTEGDYCDSCKTHRPPKAWHCNACNACILRRDHHCFFFSRCIGLYNRRYYLMYLVYIHVSMIYATYYNYYFVASKFEDHGFVLAALRILNPFLKVFIPEPMSSKDFYVLFFLFTAGLVPWSGSLLYFHMTNTLRGLTAHEYRHPAKHNWKDNWISVFGSKWYFAIVWPFANSPVIGNFELTER